MKGRDLLIVGAILVVGLLAAADALRSGGGEGPEPAAKPTTTNPAPSQETQPRSDFVRGEFPSSLFGSLLYTDRAGCRVRVLDLGGFADTSIPRIVAGCELWAPPHGRAVAVADEPDSKDRVALRVVGLDRPSLIDLRPVARPATVRWSPDGSRVMWCTTAGAGFQLRVGGRPRRLPGCPAAYTAGGGLAYLDGERVLVGGRAVVRAHAPVDEVSFGRDGSVAVVLEDRRIEVFAGRPQAGRGASRGQLAIAPALQGFTTIFSPDNCGVLLRGPGRGLVPFFVLDLGCPGGAESRTRFVASDVAWSPDGRWLAIAAAAGIEFERVRGNPRVLRWPAQAAQLAWQS